ncbi:hypothetical protein AYO20_10213 [Fonsecaea nubica]|uniref:MACPF domain-containing protein n=1 Tax=Fonsecaea nubica TaxID=856822 RepID=A0A178C890_9EURO|nr:hypothetical protein AYO20_10213 [Fonsecaea nubica]OAL26160.1 hypothetical protein AYO20_10213 [Fonsecaea nubica]
MDNVTMIQDPPHLKSLQWDDWDDLFYGKGVLTGYTIRAGQFEIPRANYDAFVLKRNATPKAESYNMSSSNAVTRQGISTQSMSESSLHYGDLGGDLNPALMKPMRMGVSVGASAARSASTTGMRTELKEETAVEHRYPKVRIFLNDEWITLSDGCLADLKALKTSKSREDLFRFYQKYGTTLNRLPHAPSDSNVRSGHIIMTQVIFGGLLRWTQEANSDDGGNHSEKASKLKAFVDARYMSAQVTGSCTSSNESRNDQADLKYEKTVYFHRLGGIQSSASDFHSREELDAWSISLGRRELWVVTERREPMQIEKFMGLMKELKWVPQLFQEIHTAARVTPLLPNLYSEIYSTNTSLAFVRQYDLPTEPALLFFQDQKRHIRFGALANSSHPRTHQTEVLFEEPIVRAKQDTPLGAFATPDSLHLFYLDDASKVCMSQFDLESRMWEAATFPGNPSERSDGSNFGFCKEENPSGYLISYRSLTGQAHNFRYEYDSGEWTSLPIGTEVSEVMSNEPGPFNQRNDRYLVPGSFVYADINRRDSSRFEGSEAVVKAELCEDNGITFHVNWLPGSESDSDDGGDPGGDTLTIPTLCLVRPGTDYCTVITKEDPHGWPGLVFISPEGSMHMIGLNGYHPDYQLEQRRIFDPDCLKASMSTYFRDLSRVLEYDSD